MSPVFLSLKGQCHTIFELRCQDYCDSALSRLLGLGAVRTLCCQDLALSSTLSGVPDSAESFSCGAEFANRFCSYGTLSLKSGL